MRLHRLEANIQPGNVASIALVKGAGFTKEGYSRRYLKISGRWRDHERWAVIAEDWRASNKLKAAHRPRSHSLIVPTRGAADAKQNRRKRSGGLST
jgi:hypothetical protein